MGDLELVVVRLLCEDRDRMVSTGRRHHIERRYESVQILSPVNPTGQSR